MRKLVEEAVLAGARRHKACAELGISLRTLERWETQEGGEDGRHGPKTTPANKLTEKERATVLETINKPELADLGPHQIVPKLADEGTYLCSEATMHRLMREAKQAAHRSRSKEPRESRPIERVATGPSQIWSWDITYLRSPVRGVFFYLYLVMDVWSRKIVGFALHAEEDNPLAAKMIAAAAKRAGIELDTLTLHADNGGPMKGSTMLATLQRLGIAASFARPRVSDDKPVLRGTVPDLEIPARLSGPGLQEPGRRAEVGRDLRGLVQLRAPAQRREVRAPDRPARAPRRRHPRAAGGGLRGRQGQAP